jgi:hypothetical protein
MAAYTVIALSLGGLRNKVYSSGDVVTQEQLPVDASELVEKGFLQPFDAKPEPVEKQPEPSVLDAVKSQSVQWPPMDEMTAKEIKAALGDKAPKGQMPKAELYALLIG